MFPAVLSLVALYALFDRLGQYIPFIGLNTHGGVIFAYLGGIALHVWTIKGYFETIDSSLEEAAALDGATPWQAFRLVLLPLSGADSGGGLYPVVYCRDYRSAGGFSAAARRGQLHAGRGYAAIPQSAKTTCGGDFAAAAVLSAIPITVVFLLAQRWLVSGLTAGGVKG
ncbi:Maltose transport system permease protein malG [Cedecea neteri]|uniref:Maltose/maltodextrin transport system permease protein MalG n=1 Tax=Cedecea neteri TaxID=158822 RepID=A0A2X2T727_9ENTR|nr:Maltose transport system permease protein malG [Cedecea neteri]